jgi:hypothetical protein
MGCSVVCLDRDLGRLRVRSTRSTAELIISIQSDLVKDPWPFASSTLGAILDVHFLASSLFGDFTRSLRPRGYLLLETVGGHGGNYLELPKSRELHRKLRRAFDFAFYRERKVGPRETDAVSVQLLAIKR